MQIKLMLLLSKAFDSINHRVLLGRLELMGIVYENSSEWFKIYLTDRQQSVYSCRRPIKLLLVSVRVLGVF